MYSIIPIWNHEIWQVKWHKIHVLSYHETWHVSYLMHEIRQVSKLSVIISPRYLPWFIQKYICFCWKLDITTVRKWLYWLNNLKIFSWHFSFILNEIWWVPSSACSLVIRNAFNYPRISILKNIGASMSSSIIYY